jgi:DNA polymerase III subunit beta
MMTEHTQAADSHPVESVKTQVVAETITVCRDDLYHALKMISGVVQQNQTIKILGHVLFRVRDGVMTLLASDSEMELQVSIPVQCVSHDLQAFTLSARNLMELCRSTAAGVPMTWSLRGAMMHVVVGSANFQINALKARDFPLFAEAKGKTLLTMTAGVLSHALTNTVFAMGAQDVRQYLNGMAFQSSDAGLLLGATDAHRLSVHRLMDMTSDPCYLTLPRKAILECHRLVKLMDESLDITMEQQDQHMVMRSSDFTLRTLLLQGPELQFDRLIPKQRDCQATVLSQILLSALQRSTVLLQDRTAHTVLSFEPNSLSIASMNFDQEKTEETLEIQYEGEAFQVTLNAHYLCDVLNVMPDETVTIHFFGQNRALYLESASSDHQSCFVIMPISIA